MTHEWHDVYRHRITPAHHLDPRSKLLVGGFFIACVLLSPRLSGAQIAGYVLILACYALLARISLKPLIKRVSAILPFALLMLISLWFSQLSFDHLKNILARSVLSLAGLMLVSFATPFPDFLRALEQSHAPHVFTLFLAFLYRYSGVLRDEATQIERSWVSRYYGKFRRRQWIRLGQILSSLFVRSYERAERVFAAMQARGFSKDLPVMHLLHFGIWDAVFVILSVFLVSCVRWAV
jgi:cobalt/nickel transport system permease protein